VTNTDQPDVASAAPEDSGADRSFNKKTALWVLFATIMASGMAIIDSTAVNVALPALSQGLGASEIQLFWVVVAYLLFLSSLILVGGVLGDMYGRRKIFALGVGIFGATSVWCGLAPDMTQLILARSFQGVGAALLVPGSLAIITAYFPESERGKAIGWWSALSALMVAVGPVLGGLFVDYATWRLVFFINVPLAVFVLWIVTKHVPESFGESADQEVDWVGAVLAVLGLGALSFGLIYGGKFGFAQALGAGAIVSGAAALAAFVVAQARVRAPMMPLSMFKSKNFAGANLLTVLLYAPLAGGTFFLPIIMIEVYGYSALAAGAALLPVVFLLATISPFAGGMINRTGATIPLVVGPIIAAVGWAYFALPYFSGNYWTTFFPGFVLMGLGMSIAVAPLTTVVMTAFDQGKAGVASGINNAASRVSGLVAVALFAALVTLTFNSELAAALVGVDLPAAALQALAAQKNLLTAAEIPDGLAPELVRQLEAAIHGSFLTGYRAAMWLSAGLAAASALVAATMIRYRPGTPE
jgi:EmrB/QacA subfamily drug resistance transporter